MCFSRPLWCWRWFYHDHLRIVLPIQQGLPSSHAWNVNLNKFRLQETGDDICTNFKSNQFEQAQQVWTPFLKPWRSNHPSKNIVPETNRALQNGPSQKESSLLTTNFLGQAVSFREGIVVLRPRLDQPRTLRSDKKGAGSSTRMLPEYDLIFF